MGPPYSRPAIDASWPEGRREEIIPCANGPVRTEEADDDSSRIERGAATKVNPFGSPLALLVERFLPIKLLPAVLDIALE